MICWGMQGKSVPRQERNRSERMQVASVAEWKPTASTEALGAGISIPVLGDTPSYPAGGVVPPGGAGVAIFASCMNGVSRSIGTGKMVVELFSAATSRSVWR